MSKQLRRVRKQIDARRRNMDMNRGKQPTFSSKSLPPAHTKVNQSEFSEFSPQQEPELKTKGPGGSFTLRLFFSTLVFLALLIVFRTDLAKLEPVKRTVEQSFEQEIQFAAISKWYESNFGRPLALLPQQPNKDNVENQQEPPIEVTPYAVPASGVIRENFDQNGRGVMVETVEGTKVSAATGGYVTDVTDKEDLGKTVIVQHYDGTESTYGMLDEITVSIYDHIDAGQQLGTVSSSEEDTGIYYFALKKGEQYINPNEVITFD